MTSNIFVILYIFMALSYKQSAYEHIRRRMQEGSLKAGDPLPYREIAKEVGVSATPVREAISRLESEGLVDQLPRVGAFVKRMGREEIKELYELREALEGHAAMLAAERITDSQMQDLVAVYTQMRELVRGRKSISDAMFSDLRQQTSVLDMQFHFMILAAACNRRVAKTVSDYRLMSKLCSIYPNDGRRTVERSMVATVRDHGRVMRAIKCRDASATRFWMQRHISLAKNAVLERIDQSSLGGSMTNPEVWSESLRNAVVQMERYSIDSRKGR